MQTVGQLFNYSNAPFKRCCASQNHSMTTIVYVFGCKRHKYWMIMVQTSECVLDLQTVNLDFIVNRVCPLKVSNYSRHPVLFARYQKPTMSNNLTTQVRIYSYTLDTERIRGMSQWNFEDRYVFGKGLEFILQQALVSCSENYLILWNCMQAHRTSCKVI